MILIRIGGFVLFLVGAIIACHDLYILGKYGIGAGTFLGLYIFIAQNAGMWHPGLFGFGIWLTPLVMGMLGMFLPGQHRIRH